MSGHFTDAERAAARASLDAQQQQRLRQRIQGLKATYPHMQPKEIAARVGTLLSYVEEVLGVRQPPDNP